MCTSKLVSEANHFVCNKDTKTKNINLIYTGKKKKSTLPITENTKFFSIFYFL